MKKLLSASFEQSLSINDDNLIMECLENASMKRILYRLLGPWAQGGILLFLYFLCLCLMYDVDHIPDLALTHFLYQYILWYGIIYTVIQLILCRSYTILSNLLFRISIGQFSIILSCCAYVLIGLFFNMMKLSFIMNALIMILTLISILYHVKQDYNDYLKKLYDEPQTNISLIDKLYLKIKKKGNLWLTSGIVGIFFLSGYSILDFKLLFYLLIIPRFPIYLLLIGVSELLYSVQCYYLIKYRESYREYYGFSTAEWYKKLK